MNYRQWKKNYKKQHGYNPPANEDKRKIKKQVKRALAAYETLDLTRTVAKMLAAAGDAIAEVFDGLSKSMRAAAEYYRDIGEAENNGKDSMQGMEERRSKAQRTGNA